MPETHSPEPWKMTGDFAVFDAQGQPVIANSRAQPNLVRHKSLANRRRIVAAVNACHGIPTEVLEAGSVRELVKELVKACQKARQPLADTIEAYGREPGGDAEEALALIDVVLAKIKSQQG